MRVQYAIKQISQTKLNQTFRNESNLDIKWTLRVWYAFKQITQSKPYFYKWNKFGH